MPLYRILIAALAFALPAAAQAQEGETIAQAPLTGFVHAFANSGAGGSVDEWVPRGETVRRWTRMVTVQRFAGVADNASPVGYINTSMATLREACPGAQPFQVYQLMIAGRPASRVRVDCPRNPETNLPETFFLLAIAGQHDMHVTQVAFRRVPTPADVSFARTQLESVTLCYPGHYAELCRNRSAH